MNLSMDENGKHHIAHEIEPPLDQRDSDNSPPELPYDNPISHNPPPSSRPIYETNTETSPLLRLPTEIRHRIYTYALGNLWITIQDAYPAPWVTYTAIPAPEPLLIPKPLEHSSTPHPILAHHTRQTHLFALPKVCRQLYAETHLLIYSLNIFYFFRVGDMQVFLEQLGDEVQPFAVEGEKLHAIKRIVPPYKCVDWVIEGSDAPFVDLLQGLEVIYLDAERIRVEWDAELWRVGIEEREREWASWKKVRVELLEREKDPGDTSAV